MCDTVGALQATARDLLNKADLLHVNGAILYSGASTLSKGDVYLLGVNPGGDERAAELTEHTIDAAVREMTSENNAYCDECWEVRGKKYDRGEAPMQRRVTHLLSKIGLDPKKVCASNLMFARSATQAGIQDPARLIKAFWPVHLAILNVVRPKAIIALGNLPFRHVRSECHSIRDRFCVKALHGSWVCESFTGELPIGMVKVIKVPHLARYALDSPKRSSVIDWIRQELWDVPPR